MTDVERFEVLLGCVFLISAGLCIAAADYDYYCPKPALKIFGIVIAIAGFGMIVFAPFQI